MGNVDEIENLEVYVIREKAIVNQEGHLNVRYQTVTVKWIISNILIMNILKTS